MTNPTAGQIQAAAPTDGHLRRLLVNRNLALAVMAALAAPLCAVIYIRIQAMASEVEYGRVFAAALAAVFAVAVSGLIRYKISQWAEGSGLGDRDRAEHAAHRHLLASYVNMLGTERALLRDAELCGAKAVHNMDNSQQIKERGVLDIEDAINRTAIILLVDNVAHFDAENYLAFPELAAKRERIDAGIVENTMAIADINVSLVEHVHTLPEIGLQDTGFAIDTAPYNAAVDPRYLDPMVRPNNLIA